MSVTPSSVKFVLKLSILSRVLLLTLQFIGKQLINHHKADAYINKYQMALNENSTLLVASPLHHYTYRAFGGFTAWDSQYFLEISMNGYRTEQHLAFLPLWPIMIGAVRNIIDTYIKKSGPRVDERSIVQNDLESYVESLLISVTLNNFFLFPLAALSIYALTGLVRGNNYTYAKRVVYWFCFNPASVFFSTSYTESLFSTLAFTGMTLLEYRSSRLSRQRCSKICVKEACSLAKISLPTIVIFSLACLTRSNGTTLVGFIGFQLLLRNLDFLKQIVQRRCENIPARCLQLAFDIITALILSIIIISSYALFQLFAYTKFCSNSNLINSRVKPSWCDLPIPHSYPNVQRKYWDVGFLSFYQYKQLPNFLLASPIVFLTILGAVKQSSLRCKHWTHMNETAYHIHAVTLTLFCSLVINVQVTTRLILSSCPAVYWYCEDMAQESRTKRKLLAGYFLTYYIIGTLLHTSFYPWT